MKRATLVLFALALLLGGVGQATAGVIYDNGAPNLANGNEMTMWIQSEDFKLTTAATINGVNFWDIQGSPGYNGSIHWQIYSDNAGNPGVVLAEGDATPTRVDTGRSFGGFLEEFSNSFGITPFNALAGVTYHLGLHNGPLTHQTRDEFYWETTDGNGTPTGREDIAPFAGSWSDNGQEHAFQLLNSPNTAVPEPASLTLLGIGAVGALGYGWRRKKQAVVA